MIDRLVLVGATGDLATRFLFPALAALQADGQLAPRFRLIGGATQKLDDEGFKRLIKRSFDRYTPSSSQDVQKRLIEGASYRCTDISDAMSVRSLLEVALESGDGPVAVYLALPPTTFAPALKALSAAGIRQQDRIAMEKPFGQSLHDACELNALAQRLFDADEEQIYRVDHVLGMATTDRVSSLRQSHIFDPLWNSRHIEQVGILWEETLALEGRAAYYDRFGALRDVVQNHMLQLVAIVAMEPSGTDGRWSHGSKHEALRSVARLDADSVARRTRRARYSAGKLTGGRSVPSYRDEEGVDPGRMTETFAEIVLDIDTARWRGAPFVLRTGKALKRRRKGILVKFRRPVEPSPLDELWVGIDGPDDITLSLRPQHNNVLELRADPPASTLPAYGHVLSDLLRGTNALAVGRREAEEAWRIVTPVLDAWSHGAVPLEEYPAGSAGPAPRYGRVEAY